MGPRLIAVDEIKDLWSYVLSIDWEDRWLWGLIAFHIICGALTGLTTLYQRSNVQIGLFLIYLLLVYCSEYINEWAAKNWKLFSEQQYFDSNGLFICLLFATPLLINCLVIVALWLWNAANLLINMKKAQLRHQRAAHEQTQQQKDK